MKNLTMILSAALFMHNVAFADSNVLNTTTTTKLAYDCQSLAWNLAAAKKDDIEAQYQVGMKYFNGEEVQADQKLAYQWLEVVPLV